MGDAMPEMKNKYRQGTPNWVDVTSTDVPKTLAFYGALFGWDSLDLGPESGGYGFFVREGKPVAGYAPARPGVPAAWSTYIAVDDVNEAAAKVVPSGGIVLAEPMDLPNNSGRMAFIADPTGAAYGLYEARDHIGSVIVNEAGSLVWNELASRDLDRSLVFLQAVVGTTSTPLDDTRAYFMVNVGDRAVAGAMPMPPSMPDGVPSHWLPYFLVGDVDAAARVAADRGATVVVPPSDMAVGRFTVLMDPSGATFTAAHLTQVDDPNF
jgi:uncharacterized protein